MTLSIRLPALPRNVTPRNVRILKENSTAREALLQQMVQGFERKYGTSLETFEGWLACGQAPEHPGWEDSIEWRNAVEELEQTHVSGSIFAWLDNLLAQSAAS